MNNINFINPLIKEFFEKNDKLKAKCKIRYRQEDQDCEIIKLKDDLYKVNFSKKQRAIASGQICAVYI
jgi:tRNA U34 2-thiouridine synthase MnmA/TrmU